MEILLFFSVLYSAWMKVCLSGQIFTWDVDIIYPQAAMARNIIFYFSLESGLAEGQFIHIKFPDPDTKINNFGTLSTLGESNVNPISIRILTTSNDVFVKVDSHCSSECLVSA